MNLPISSYDAISDGSRRRILDMLRQGGLPAGVIAGRFREISRPAVSKHLAILRRSRLVSIHKRGRERIYTLNAAPLKEVSGWLKKYERLWDLQLESFKQHVESESKGGKNEG